MTGMMTVQSIQLEHKYLKDLIPADYNPRKDLKPGDREYESLKRSIERYGVVEPIIWNRATGHIVGGHQRLKVLLNAGETETDCVVVDLDEDNEKGLNIALNKISGDWDLEKLDKLIEDLKAANFDISLTGFSPEELDKMLREVMKESQDDEFDVEAELSKPAFSKAGDLWTLGDHRLYCGDSTKPESYDILMGGKKANLVVTDPPYNVDYHGTVGTIKNDNMDDDAFYRFLLAAFNCMEAAMDDDASIYVFHADSKGLIFRQAFSDAGFYCSQTCIWKKPSFVFGRSYYHWQHEPVLFGWKKNGKSRWYADRKQTTIWEFEATQKNDLHPTMKPIPLIAYPIMNSTMTGNRVLDPFGGSGSTLIACQQTGRECFTMELDEKFCDVIVKRYAAAVGSTERIAVQRDGATCCYEEIVKE